MLPYNLKSDFVLKQQKASAKITSASSVCTPASGHCVIYGVEHGVESWSGFWSGMKSNLELSCASWQNLVLIDQLLVNAYFYSALCT